MTNIIQKTNITAFPTAIGTFMGMLFLLCTSISIAQTTPTVSSEIDTTAIKIGEQIHYKITVEADSTDVVFFPEGQTFSPLETVDAIIGDTIRNKDRVTLQRTYALTQFDSGVYTIPPQRIAINEKPFFSDSVVINVATIAVDTLAQKMYDIKPMLNVEKSNSELWKTLLYILIPLLIIGGLIYWFFIRKKPLTEEEKVALLPPYDRAILELKRLENSKYLIQDEYKQYYSELTGIVRSYLEEDAHVSALESTTDQLIDKLEMMKDAGELKLDEDTIQQFKRILQTADLVKFAKSKPQTSVAENDRKAVEQIVTKTKEALPEPTEEELLKNEEYLEELSRKNQKKKIKYVVIGVVTAFILSFVAAGSYYGFGYVTDTLTGHATKKLKEGEWVNSTYGFPPITIETPQVLKRVEVKIPAEAKAAIKETQTFAAHNEDALFTVAVTSTVLTEEVEPDVSKTVEQILKNLEDKGAKNITTKQEDFTTLTGGVKGVKVYGSGNFPISGSKELEKGNYAILNFGGKGFQQQIYITWLADDTYAEDVVERIINSVEVKTQL